MKILIVENSAGVRRMIRNLVAGVASEVVECADGGNAFEAYRTHNPDWVLMDIALKEADALDVTSRIKACHPEARVVILTNYNDPHLRRLSQRAGAFAYVLKETLFELRGLVSAGASQLKENNPDNLNCAIAAEASVNGPDIEKSER
jgi:DNA-binding NarL/FixJ family response regulator